MLVISLLFCCVFFMLILYKLFSCVVNVGVNVVGICWISKIGCGKLVGNCVKIVCNVIGLFVDVLIVINWYCLLEVWMLFVVDGDEEFVVGVEWLKLWFGCIILLLCELVEVDGFIIGVGWVNWEILWWLIFFILFCNNVIVFLLLCVMFLNFFGKKLSVLVFNVLRVVVVLLWVSDENIKIGVGVVVIIFLMVFMLLSIGIFIFMVIILGFSFWVLLIVLCLFIVNFIIWILLFCFNILFILWWKKFELLIINILIVIGIFLLFIVFNVVYWL